MPKIAIVVILLLSSLAATAVASHIGLRFSEGAVSSRPRITVDVAEQLAPVGDILGAVATENYWGPTDSIHADWHTSYLGRTIDRIRELTPANGQRFAIRFGHSPTDGSWGKDGYHWMQAFDPRAWSTSIDEFMDYVDRVGGTPYIAVNFGSGTAEEAAGLVAYVNGTDPTNSYVQMRVENGRAEPYQVRHWIVGFEQYAPWQTGDRDDRPFDFANPTAQHGGDPEWYGKPASNPEWFAARATQYARAMRAASASPVEISAPANNWDLGYWGQGEASVRTLAPQLGDAIDGFSLHFYPANPTYGTSDADLLGRTETLATRLDDFGALLDRYGPPGKQLKVTDVEFNNNSSSDEQTHQLVNGIFVADTLRVLAEKGVGSAFYFAISTGRGEPSGFTYFERGDVDQPMPTYLAMKLVGQYLGTDVLKSSVSRSSPATAPGGRFGSFTYPTLTTLASRSADGKTLFLVVINKHATQDQTAELQLNGAAIVGEAQFTRLDGPSLKATADQVSLTEWKEFMAMPLWQSYTHTFPAHSITGIRIPIH